MANDQECDNKCSSCSKAKDCKKANIKKLTPNKNSNIKKIIGVVSGKGGVGKSLVCGLLSKKLNDMGQKVGILDADVTGPSVPKMFGINEKIYAEENAMYPQKSKNGIKMISSNLILDDPTSPVAWRGPVVTGAIQQFFNQTNWGDIDVMLVDMPPGTSDVFLTVMQLLSVDGIVCVSTPQDLVGMIVKKAINLANRMNVDVISLVENMSYFKCDNCGKKHEIFGSSQIEKIAIAYNINSVDKIGINPEYAKYCDSGNIEDISSDEILNNTTNAIKEI